MQVLHTLFLSRKPRDQRVIHLGLMALGLAAASAASAQSSASAMRPSNPWSVSVGVASVSSAEYEGADRRVSGLVPVVDVSYSTRDWGRFGFGVKQRGMSWTPLETEQYSIAVVLGSDPGRRDDAKGTLLRPGSERLRGMGNIQASSEVGVLAQAQMGVALSAQFMQATAKRKLAANGDLESHGGTRATLGLELPWQSNKTLSASLGVQLEWANTEHMQAYFGVTAAQATRSKLRAYTPQAGIKSVGLSVSVNYAIDSHWAATSALHWSQLRGDAAASPLVQRKASTLLMAGLVHRF